MTVVVTGASGQLGRLVAVQLLGRLPVQEVILASHNPQDLADFSERGVEVRYGDFDSPGSLAEAFDGADRLLLISTMAFGRRVDQHRAALDAALSVGIERVVYTSLTNPVAGHPAGAIVEEHRETEELLHAAPVDSTILRNAAYAELQVPLAAMAVTYGRLVTNAGDGRIAPISRSDCAEAAVAVLAGDGHEGRTYEITGPDALTQADIARLASEVSGRPVKVMKTGDRKLSWGLGRLGTPKPVARAIVDLGIATREGYFDVVDDAFERLTGRRPRTLRDVFISHRGELADTDASAVAHG